MRLPKAINTPPTRRKWAQIASSRFNPLSTTRLHNPPNNTSWLTKSFTTREEEVYWTWNKVNCLRSVMPLSPFSSSFSFPHNLNAMCSLTCFEASSKVVLACNLLADHLLLKMLPNFGPIWGSSPLNRQNLRSDQRKIWTKGSQAGTLQCIGTFLVILIFG